MKTIAEVSIPYSSVHEVGKSKFAVSSMRTVTLEELDEDHHSKMRYELTISHHDEEDGKSAVGADELFRFLDEKSARAHFEAYVRALAGDDAKATKLLGPLTLPGKKV